ncbi:DUF3221 domain-containing protein [Neobacillus sp. 19]|uniref:DUF3221 domain-containing protein n=1 Tax=Neobacillus sp. 19 TaxID=3394458 RepID=UPI003BF73613
MKKLFIVPLIVGLILAGCSGKDEAVKGTIDLKGSITEIDQAGNRIMIEDKDHGRVWVTLHETGNIAEFEINQEIVVWIDGEVKESSPAQAKALNMEHTQK